MVTAKDQIALENNLKKLEKQRDNLTIKIRQGRKKLDDFIQENGNLKLQEESKARWLAMQPIFEERRKNPAWQKWREDFMASRPKTVSDENTKNPNAFMFVHESVTEEDKELFLGPLNDNDEFIVFDDTWTMAHILVHVGVFPSLTQARKNNGDGPIQEGFFKFSRGKGMRRKDITILNKF